MPLLRRTLIALSLLTAVLVTVPPIASAEDPTPPPTSLVRDLKAEARYEQTLAFAAAVHRAKLENFYAAVWYRAVLDYAVKVEAAKRAASSGACGGDLPTCAIMRCESGGNIHAENPSSTASGKWQVLDSTWRAYARQVPAARAYSHASHAPEWVQDAVARAIWNGGRGRSQWVC